MTLVAIGRKKLFGERITLPLSESMLAEVDASLSPGEIRLDFIRKAIRTELDNRCAAEIAYVEALVRSAINGKVFWSFELKTRSTVLFDAKGYGSTAEQADAAILERAAEFAVRVVVIVSPEVNLGDPRISDRQKVYVWTGVAFEWLHERLNLPYPYSDVVSMHEISINAEKRRTRAS